MDSRSLRFNGSIGVVSLVGISNATAASTLPSVALNLDADTTYIIEVSLQNATASGSVLSLYYNADTTAGNYDEQCNTLNNTTASPARANDARVANLDASEFTDLEITIWKGRDGKPQAMVRVTRSSGTAIILQEFRHKWRTANTNVTLAMISSSVASALTGTMRVYKRSPLTALNNAANMDAAAFPSNPVNGQRIRRTDRQFRWFYYDASLGHWLSEQVFSQNLRWAPAAYGLALTATEVNALKHGVPLFQGSADVYLLQHRSQFFVSSGSSALGASHDLFLAGEHLDENRNPREFAMH